MTRLTLLLLCSALLLGQACETEDPRFRNSNADYEILEAAVFGCSNYETTRLSVDFQVNTMVRFGDYYAYGGFEDLLIVEGRPGGTPVLAEDISANRFLALQNRLLICGEDGFYEFTVAAGLNPLDGGVRCKDVIIGPEGRIIASLVNQNYLYELRNNNLVTYSDFVDIERCVGLNRLAYAGNNTIWATGGCGAGILRFDGPTLVNRWDNTNAPLPEQLPDLFVLPYGDEAIAVAKNGTGFYRILKYNTQDWILLRDLSLEAADSPKAINMALPSIVDVYLRGDYLYLATTLAGCRGFQRIDVSKNTLLTDEDLAIIEDPAFSSQCHTGAVRRLRRRSLRDYQ
jgi:hypothetical protein